MKTRKPPRLVPTQDLPFFFRSNGIAFTAAGSLKLGFGRGNDQYRLYNYSGPAEDETMGIFFELHTEDFFEVDSGPHVAIGLRGPVREDPHRGRGLAIGMHEGDPRFVGHIGQDDALLRLRTGDDPDRH